MTFNILKRDGFFSRLLTWGSLAFFAVVLLQSLLFASAPATTAISLDQSSSIPLIFNSSTKISLSGDSTFHPFSSIATNADISFGLNSAEAQFLVKDFAAGIKKIINSKKGLGLSVNIPVKNLKSGEGALDDNLYATLKHRDFPNISFELKDYQVVRYIEADDSYIIKARGILTISGAKREVVLEPKVHYSKSEGLVIAGEETILMTDYGIKPPTILMFIKVDNKITVKYSLGINLDSQKIKKGGAKI